MTITAEATGELLDRNAWATDPARTESGLHDFVTAARTRGKSANENNNVLKNYGYHLERNFGHGQQYLALVRVMLNWLAFLFHTTLDLCDAHYRRVRAELATRQTFFHDVQALPRYLYFASWQALSNFMFTQRELDTDAPAPPLNAPNAADACCRTRPVVRRCSHVGCVRPCHLSRQAVTRDHHAPTCLSAPTAVPKACSPLDAANFAAPKIALRAYIWNC